MPSEKHLLQSAKGNQMNANRPASIPTGSVRRFGEYGVLYIVGTAAGKLPDGDWMVNIELPESGEKTQYRLSKIIADPKAH